MWALRKSSGNRSPQEQQVLSTLFEHSTLLKNAYPLSERFTQILNTETTRNGGIRRLNNWMSAVRASDVSCFNTFMDTLKKWLPEVANYFVQRENSGFVEGFNNRIKVLKRRCYGIIHREHLYQRISLDLGEWLSIN